MITGTVTGDDRVIARLDSMGAAIQERVVKAVLRSAIDLESYVRKNKLAGQLLKRRTGTLAASIQHKVVVSGGSVTGIVGSRVNESAPLKYAAIHEYGFSGQVNVRAHTRRNGASVREHVRNENVSAKRYLRGSLEERRDTYIEWIAAAVKVPT